MQEQDTRKSGIIGLIIMLVLAAAIVVLSNPIYRWLTGAGRGEAYTSVQKGYGGDVTVTLSVEDGKVLQLKAEGPSETPGIGAAALTSFNESFAQLKNTALMDLKPELDAVSGATITSRAVKKGLSDVILQAGGPAEGDDKEEQPVTDTHTTATP